MGIILWVFFAVLAGLTASFIQLLMNPIFILALVMGTLLALYVTRPHTEDLDDDHGRRPKAARQ